MERHLHKRPLIKILYKALGNKIIHGIAPLLKHPHNKSRYKQKRIVLKMVLQCMSTSGLDSLGGGSLGICNECLY